LRSLIFQHLPCIQVSLDAINDVLHVDDLREIIDVVFLNSRLSNHWQAAALLDPLNPQSEVFMYDALWLALYFGGLHNLFAGDLSLIHALD
jgi:hypothetical protein